MATAVLVAQAHEHASHAHTGTRMRTSVDHAPAKQLRAIDSKRSADCAVDSELHVYTDDNPLDSPMISSIPFSKSSRFRFAWSEMLGRRQEMEDEFLLHGDFMGPGKYDLFGLFDGHSGRQAAEFAARTFPGVLGQQLEAESDVLVALRSSFLAVHEQFREQIKGDLEARHAGATALLVLVSQDRVYVANVGDTRAVICRGGKAERLSFDHKPTEEEDRIRALGGHVSGGATKRVNGMVAVSRAIGDFAVEPQISCEPFLNEAPLSADDEFLILACDGVWDEIDDQGAVDIVRSEPDLQRAARTLRDAAFLRGSDDNISVVVVRLADALPVDSAV
eukprot:TRINITY_DN23177_c0_g1_i1.p1 TRINITY_DN23177_c0_g1~~TRINITY_DN23177_c0_g1_i1.p1  ORF type:complete len:335 (+),score=67.77 TRINITY_DN23177_c0_g1_i1:197-1201(+)